jgi:arginase family enzyme
VAARDTVTLVDRVYHVLGVPLRTGSLYPGSENDAKPYRDAGLLERLRTAGCVAVDDGDVALPSYLPHHAIPPIRSWPGPRIAWDVVGERLAPVLATTGAVPLLIGCDCSIVVGTATALRQAAGDDVHVLYVDGDFDDAAPDAGRCQSAAALAVWLLTDGAPFRPGSPLPPSQVTVIGASAPAAAGAVRALPLAEVRRMGAPAAARRALATIPASAAILVHLDVDVFAAHEMPAAYFPHAEGLSLAEGVDLLRELVGDPRVRLLEVAEYASLRDGDQRAVGALVELLARALGR